MKMKLILLLMLIKIYFCFYFIISLLNSFSDLIFKNYLKKDNRIEIELKLALIYDFLGKMKEYK